MKIYRADYHDKDHGAIVSWHTNKLAAEREVNRNAGPDGPCGVKLIDFPVRRAAIVDWLNIYLTRDNG